jgi:hypothetical protein
MADLSKNRVCCGHAAGHFVEGMEQPRRSDPQALQRISPQLPCASHLPSVGPVYGGTDGLIFGALSHEQIGKNEGICHHKMATKQDSTG